MCRNVVPASDRWSIRCLLALKFYNSNWKSLWVFRVTSSNYKRFFLEKRARNKARTKCTQHRCLLEVFVILNNEQINVTEWGGQTISHRSTHTHTRASRWVSINIIRIQFSFIWTYHSLQGLKVWRSVSLWPVKDEIYETVIHTWLCNCSKTNLSAPKLLVSEDGQSWFVAYRLCWERGLFYLTILNYGYL